MRALNFSIINQNQANLLDDNKIRNISRKYIKDVNVRLIRCNRPYKQFRFDLHLNGMEIAFRQGERDIMEG